MPEVKFTGNQISSPAWRGDFGNREHLVPGGAKLNVAGLPAVDASVVTLTAAAAVGALSLAVTALTNPVPAGTLLSFGVGLYAKTTALAAAGAMTIPVEALPSALASGATATYAGVGAITLASGTPVGRTIADRNAGIGFRLALSTDAEVYLLVNPVVNAAFNNDIDLYRHGSIVKENYLPNSAAIVANAALINLLRSLYTCTQGAN